MRLERPYLIEVESKENWRCACKERGDYEGDRGELS